MHAQATAYFPPEAEKELAAVVRWTICLPYLLQAHLQDVGPRAPEVSLSSHDSKATLLQPGLHGV